MQRERVARAFACSAIALLATAAFTSCRSERTRPLRTEPWQASASASAVSARGRARYVVSSGSITLDLSTSTRVLRGTLNRVEGSIDFDASDLSSSRATLRADLLSLELSDDLDAGDAAALRERAFDWLEVSASRPERREQNRWAELRVTALRGNAAGRKGPATAHAELTLHAFRVPVEVEIEVALEGEAGALPSALEVRTRRPWSIPLEAHDILPRRPDGSVAQSELGVLGRDVGRRAKVSAQLRATPAASAGGGRREEEEASGAKSRN